MQLWPLISVSKASFFRRVPFVFKMAEPDPRLATAKSVCTTRRLSQTADNLEGINPVNLSFQEIKPTSGSLSHCPVIFLHGLFGSKSNFKYHAKEVSNRKNCQVFCLDARNHGESPHSDKFTLAHMVADIKHFMKGQDITKAVLIGHSMGGRVAMATAFLEPNLIEQLIVCDIVPYKKENPEQAALLTYLRAMQSLRSRLDANLSLSEGRAMALRDLAQVVKDVGVRQFLITNLVKEKDAFEWRINVDVLEKNFANMRNFPYTDMTYDGETFFIGGSKSPFLTKEDKPLIKKAFPNAKFFFIQDAGHWVHSEKPKEFLDIVTECIK